MYRPRDNVNFAESFRIHPGEENPFIAVGVIDIDIDEYLW